MKRIKLLLIFTLLIWAAPVLAQEKIADFDVTLDIKQDAEVIVTERITYDFGQAKRHGIYRLIPFRYQERGGNYNLRLEVMSITDEQGNERQFRVSREGDKKRIRIGDPDATISGRHTYIIKYRVRRAINKFEDHDELYWNVTGNDWDLAIEQTKAAVNLPAAVNEDDFRAQCFAGAYGSGEDCLSTRYNFVGQGRLDQAVFIHDRLKANQGMTVVVGIPLGLIKHPALWTEVKYFLADNYIFFLPVLVFAFLFFLWYRQGRDPRGRGAIITQFGPPPGLSPAEAGTVIDERADKRDISAELIDLAIRGFIRIEQQDKKGLLGRYDYELHRLKGGDGVLAEHERMLLKALFKDGQDKVKLSDLRDEFYKDWQKVIKQVYAQVVEKGYFKKNPNRIRSYYLMGGFFLAFIGFWSVAWFGPAGLISILLSAVFVAVFGRIMPARTKAGVELKEYLLGLERYMEVAEKDRIEFHNAPAKNPEHFEKLLPYAMAMKTEKAWARQFEGIYNQEPSWYHSPGSRTFTALALTDSLDGFSSQANAALTSRPSSAGGGGSGFSGGGAGGGFGGGGGGSW